MELDEVVNEAYDRWGESAAVRKYSSHNIERFEVGYFRRRGTSIVFCALGSGATPKQALEAARKGFSR
jgi:hypothetical protein